MSKELKKYMRNILLSTLLLAAAGGVVFTHMAPGKYLTIMPWMLGFFAVVTILTFAYQLRLAKKNKALFTRYSMLVSLFRLVAYSLFAFIYLTIQSEKAVVFIICLVVIYLVFTYLEVSEISRISQKYK